MFKLLGVTLGLVLMSTATFAQDMAAKSDADALLALPDVDFRTEWTHLGSYVVPDKEAPGAGFHDVYTQRNSAKAYQETGKFPDGAVLIKEIRGLVTKEQTTGLAHNAGDVGVWFVMVKDSTKKYEGKSKHWDKGWGWALYKPDNPTKNVSESAEETCLACHTPAENTDWVFVDGYPTLKK